MDNKLTRNDYQVLHLILKNAKIDPDVRRDIVDKIESIKNELQSLMSAEKPCPFCGHYFSTEDFYGVNSNIDGFYFFCVCGAQGPIAETEEEAELLWNKRCIK